MTKDSILKKFQSKYFIQENAILPGEVPLVQIIQIEEDIEGVNVRHRHVNSEKENDYCPAVLKSDSMIILDKYLTIVAFRPATKEEIVKYLLNAL